MEQNPIKNIIADIAAVAPNFPQSRRELFKRVEFCNLFKLAAACTKEMRRLEAGEGPSREYYGLNIEASEDRKKVANVLLGFGERDLGSEGSLQVSPAIFERLPYLLLDVRTKEEFLALHLKTAKHYPAALLSRSNASEIEDMMHYKNQQGKLIILYDNDENIGARVATNLVQRGYDNVYLLCGGMKYATMNFPGELISAVTTGHSPSELPSAILSAATTIQIKEDLQHFSLDDVEIIKKCVSL